MNTTALLVDILIIGIQSLIWITALVFSYVLPVNSALTLIENNPATVLFFLITISYTFGIIFDYIFSMIFRMFRNKEEKELYGGGLIIRILLESNEVQKFLENQYARLRISRATVINLPLITISLCCFVLNNSTPSRLSLCATVFTILVVGMILSLLSIISWYNRKSDYLRYVKESKLAADKGNK